MTLVRAGFKVTLFSRGPQSDPRAQIVRDIGATYLSGQDHAPGDLPAVLGAVDVVYEAAGASKLAFEVLEVLGPNAVFVFTGVPGRKAPVEIDAARVMQQLVLNNQVVFGTVNAGRDAYEAAVEDLALFRARWPAALDALFDTKLDLAEVPELLEGERASAVKPVVALG
jgi:threonine dehydrogenase-like Zn-dependent dehydrogenase